MTSPDLHRRLLHPLRQTGIPYMVTGAVATIAYAEPRMANDVYLVVRSSPGDAQTLISAYPSPEYCLPPIDAVREDGAQCGG